VKIILREHVEHLGQRGEIANVAAGYARNYLLPKGLAWEATAGNLKQIKDQRRVWADRDAKEILEARELAQTISAISLSVTRKAGASGTLYGSVTNTEIAEMIAAKGVTLNRRRIVLPDPIKSVGIHPIKVRIHPEVIGELSLEVLAEDTGEPVAPPPPPAPTPAAADEPADESEPTPTEEAD